MPAQSVERWTGPSEAWSFAHGLEPGIGRVGRAPSFAYVRPDGARVTDAFTLSRIAALAIPPAWAEVWISQDPDTHLQATGRDARGRKQYVYHPGWRHDRDEVKFRDMELFARRQPALRRRIAGELESDGLDTSRVLALALRLLDVGLFRVGSERSRRDNHHFGLTTLCREHVQLRDGTAVFDYVGKAGVRHRTVVADPPSIAALAQLAEARRPGEQLLAAQTARGWSAVHREDVNNFLRVLAEGPFSAKEYRTWNATVIAACTLSAERPSQKRSAIVASRAVAAALGNTPTVARQSYIDPRVLDRYAAGRTIRLDRLPTAAWTARRRVESRVLALLE